LEGRIYYNLLSGALWPSSGSEEFEGRDVTGLSAASLCPWVWPNPWAAYHAAASELFRRQRDKEGYCSVQSGVRALQRSGHMGELRGAESRSLNLDINQRALYLDLNQRLQLQSVNAGGN
jgi:hypothetical protein